MQTFSMVINSVCNTWSRTGFDGPCKKRIIKLSSKLFSFNECMHINNCVHDEQHKNLGSGTADGAVFKALQFSRVYKSKFISNKFLWYVCYSRLIASPRHWTKTCYHGVRSSFSEQNFGLFSFYQDGVSLLYCKNLTKFLDSILF